MFIVWHFTKYRPVGQLQGIFDNEEMAKNACSVGDCYHPIKVNTFYEQDIEVSDVAFYKCPSGDFKNCNEYLREIHEQKEQTAKIR